MTREEARKILQKLATNSLCVEDYSNDKIKISSRMGAQALRADLARVTAERDAAVWDLETTMAHVNPIFDTCGFCKNAQCYARGGIEFCHPEWRGIRKED